MFSYSELFSSNIAWAHRYFLTSVEHGLEANAGTKSCEYSYGPRQNRGKGSSKGRVFDTICFNSLLPHSIMCKIVNREIPQDLVIRRRWRENRQQFVHKKGFGTALQHSEAIFSIIANCKFIRNLARVLGKN